MPTPPSLPDKVTQLGCDWRLIKGHSNPTVSDLQLIAVRVSKGFKRKVNFRIISFLERQMLMKSKASCHAMQCHSLSVFAVVIMSVFNAGLMRLADQPCQGARSTVPKLLHLSCVAPKLPRVHRQRGRGPTGAVGQWAAQSSIQNVSQRLLDACRAFCVVLSVPGLGHALKAGDGLQRPLGADQQGMRG